MKSIIMIVISLVVFCGCVTTNKVSNCPPCPSEDMAITVCNPYGHCMTIHVGTGDLDNEEIARPWKEYKEKIMEQMKQHGNAM